MICVGSMGKVMVTKAHAHRDGRWQFFLSCRAWFRQPVESRSALMAEIWRGGGPTEWLRFLWQARPVRRRLLPGLERGGVHIALGV